MGFNDTSTLVGHFVSRNRRDSRGDERGGQGRKRNRNEREETKEITRPVPRQDSSPDIAHFVSGNF